MDICRKYTDKVFKKEFLDFADMKNFALSKTTGDWVLSVDADEKVTKELKSRIEDIMSGEGSIFGFFVKRKSKMFGRWFNFCGTQNDYQMRLFKRIVKTMSF